MTRAKIFTIYIIFGAMVYIMTHKNDVYDNIPKSKLYRYINKQKNKNKYTYDIDIESCVRKYAESISNVKIPKTFTYEEIITVLDECKKYDIPPRFIFRLIQAESSFKKTAKSKVGASGYMQLMPKTYRHFKSLLNLNDDDNHKNLKVGIYYVHHLYNKWKGYSNKTRWKMTFLSYNYGITKVKNNITYFQSPEFNTYWYIKKIIG